MKNILREDIGHNLGSPSYGVKLKQPHPRTLNKTPQCKFCISIIIMRVLM